MMRQKPIATVVSHDKDKTLWIIQWPCTGQRWGKKYFATSYADNDELLIQTAAKRQVATEQVAKKLDSAIRQAIATVKAKQKEIEK